MAPEELDEQLSDPRGLSDAKRAGCGAAIIAGLIVAAIVAILGLPRGDGTGATATASPTATAEEPTPTAAATGTDTPAGTPGENVISPPTQFDGESGGPIGCITCDGQPRFLHIERSGVGVGAPDRAAHQIEWPTDGVVTEFAVSVTGANRGNYSFNIMVGDAVELGCAITPGQTSCENSTGELILDEGDLVTIVITEAGTTVEGAPADRGEFSVSWRFVFSEITDA